MRDPRRTVGWALFGIAAAAAVGIAAAALFSASFAWNQVAEYRSPYLSTPLTVPDATLTSATPAPAQSRRVVLVIVDGLTRETSEKMRALRTLREFGADVTMTVSQPSLSYPGWTTILSGATPRFSGVTTNWWKGRVQVETLLDAAISAGERTVVVGPTSLGTLYGADRATAHFYKDYDPKKPAYLSTTMVVRTVDLVKRFDPRFVLVHLPDIDEAGHAYGAASPQYAAAAQKVDTDLSVLVSNVQDGHTTFVVVADHGHIATGGHGGWEPEVTHIPAVLAGSGIALATLDANQQDLAPTVAAVAGLPVPRHSVGAVMTSVLASVPPATIAAATDQRMLMLANVYDVVRGWPAGNDLAIVQRRFAGMTETELRATLAGADWERLARERDGRFPLALGLGALALAAVVAIGISSWRALLGALVGTGVYYAVYEGFFFGVHRLWWSLSVTNSEAALKAFFAARVAEAALGGLLGVLAAGLVYVALRREPKPARAAYLPGWLALGPATVLVAQATLAVQVAWYVWAWGLRVTWILPDLRLGFKADLDLLQMGTLGLVALLSPLATLLVGRYHPRVARVDLTAHVPAPPPAPSTPDGEE
jgi:hypothetical protein